ncbi:MAG TPA: CcdB family protein [Holophaga sp.]|nr:CcdB family protein [Holophaga sp.]
MGQFAVHAHPDPGTRARIPFLMDIQSDLLSVLATRLVVPLYRREAAGPMTMSRLTPTLRFQDLDLVAMVPEMAGIPSRVLGNPIGEAPALRAEILQALDLLSTGF